MGMGRALAPTWEDPMSKMVIRGDRVTAAESVIDPVVFQSLSRVGKKLKWHKREGVGGCLKSPQK